MKNIIDTRGKVKRTIEIWEDSYTNIVIFAIVLCILNIVVAIKKPFINLLIVFSYELIAFLLGREFYRYNFLSKELKKKKITQ